MQKCPQMRASVGGQEKPQEGEVCTDHDAGQRDHDREKYGELGIDATMNSAHILPQVLDVFAQVGL